MKYLLTLIFLGLAGNVFAAATPDFKIQKASFSAQDELQVKTQVVAQINPGPTANTKNRQIASEKSNQRPSLEERQRQLIDQEITYWKFKND